MNEKIRIFFDMDGVLANFDLGLVELCELHVPDQGFLSKEENDILWKKIREVGHYYLKLEPIEGSIKMIEDTFDLLNGNVEILTGVPNPRNGILEASQDKIEWAKKYISKDIKVNTVLRKDKINFCKSKYDILVDDFYDNIKEWKNAGGTGIVFKNTVQAIAEIKMTIDSLNKNI